MNDTISFDFFSMHFTHLFAPHSLFMANLCFSLLIFVSRRAAADTVAHTNRIQREFFSKVRIRSSGAVLASSTQRQKTNFLKRGVLSLRAADTPSPCEA